MPKGSKESEKPKQKDSFNGLNAIFEALLATGVKGNCDITSRIRSADIRPMYELLRKYGIEVTTNSSNHQIHIGPVPEDKCDSVRVEMAQFLQDCWMRDKGYLEDGGALLGWVLTGSKTPLLLAKSNGAIELSRLLNVVLIANGLSAIELFERGGGKLSIIALKQGQVLSLEQRQALVTFLLGVMQKHSPEFKPIRIDPAVEEEPQPKDLVRWVAEKATDQTLPVLEIPDSSVTALHNRICTIIGGFLFRQKDVRVLKKAAGIVHRTMVELCRISKVDNIFVINSGPTITTLSLPSQVELTEDRIGAMIAILARTAEICSVRQAGASQQQTPEASEPDLVHGGSQAKPKKNSRTERTARYLHLVRGVMRCLSMDVQKGKMDVDACQEYLLQNGYSGIDRGRALLHKS
jgi:hypothetical protein